MLQTPRHSYFPSGNAPHGAGEPAHQAARLSTFRHHNLLTGAKGEHPKQMTTTEAQQQTFANGRVRVMVGDLTRQDVAAIVNAANLSLLGGGGVDGAIHRAGGPTILAECRELRRTLFQKGLPTGEAVITGAGELSAQYVIHTVGPMYGKHKGLESELLAACYRNSLIIAAIHSLKSIAFPAISTGVYGYPRDEAAAVASQAVQEFLDSDDSLTEVRLVFFQPGDAGIFLRKQKFR